MAPNPSNSPPAATPIPQVERAHYDFQTYMTPFRWASLWRQVDLSLALQPDSVLEVGGGTGLFKRVLADNGVAVTTADIAEDLEPDLVASVLDLPCDDRSFDLTCAFQVLEHLPYEQFIPALKELARVCRKAVLLSLPDATPGYPFRISLPGKGIVDFAIPRPYFKQAHRFDGEHYWEINKKETPLKRLLRDIEEAGLHCQLARRFPDNLYHRFFIIRQNKSA